MYMMSLSSHYHPIGYRGAEQRAPQLSLFFFFFSKRKKKEENNHAPQKRKITKIVFLYGLYEYYTMELYRAASLHLCVVILCVCVCVYGLYSLERERERVLLRGYKT